MSEKSVMDRVISSTRLIKAEDLNHHQTLYGGRALEWAVQQAYIAAQNCFDDTARMIFTSVRDFAARRPIRVGQILELVGRIVYVGDSTLGVHIEGRAMHPRDNSQRVLNGTFLFCCIDENNKPTPHGLRADRPEKGAERVLWDKADGMSRNAQSNTDGT